MSEHRIPSKKSIYYLPKETFLTVVHYCKQYPEWEAELKTMEDPRKAVAYDQDRVQTSCDSDSTSAFAMRRLELSKKKDTVDHVAQHVAGDLWHWLILGVCHDNPYHYLSHRGIPCGKDFYYKLRRRFYYEMAQKI